VADDCSLEVDIQNDGALHLRPFQEMAARASEFSADITVRRGGKSADAKSIFDLMELAAEPGPVRLQAEGDDAPRAVEALAAIIHDAVERVLREEQQQSSPGKEE
jgi:phosphotransferase system HPr (HPr) family protein